MVSVVQKPFDGPGGEIPAGTVIDTTGWRNEQRLHNTRHLRAATETEVAELRAGQAGASEPRSASSRRR